MRRILPFAFFLLSSLSTLLGLDPRWVRVLSGDVVAGPVCVPGRVYAGCDDRKVICLSADGAFLWSRSLSGKRPLYLTMTPQGILLEVSTAGTVTACNQNGLFLWRLSGGDVPSLPPYPGRDGRTFLVYRNRIVCVGIGGQIKWTSPLDGSATVLSETHDGDLLVSARSGHLFRYSPFGELLEVSLIPGGTTLLHPAPSGFYAVNGHGLLSRYDVRARTASDGRPGTEVLWDYRGSSPCIALSNGELGTLCAVFSDGTIAGVNSTDGITLWTVHTNQHLSAPADLSFSYGQFNLLTPDYAAAISERGQVQWAHQLSSRGILQCISDDGVLFSSAPGWRIQCYRPETRILGQKKHIKPPNYGILRDVSPEWGFTIAVDTDEIQRFFTGVERDIENGSVGPDEIDYARRLTAIIRGSSGYFPAGKSWSGTERGRACSLLGKIGSTEYREVLLEASRGEFDESLAVGILHGLSLMGPDIDGFALDGIGRLTKEAGVQNATFQRFVCSALYSIARYSSGDVSLRAVAMLSDFSREPYVYPVRAYARQIMGNLLESD